MNVIGVAIIGCGRWGQNLISVFSQLSCAQVVACCNQSNRARLNQLSGQYPHMETTQSLGAVWTNPKVDAIVVATPDHNHFEIARQGLEAGKHVFVEKPLASSLANAQELVTLAEARGKVLMTGHILQFHPAVQWIKRRMGTASMSPVSMLSTRVEFGIVRASADLLWSSAVHDVSIIQYLLESEPEEICAVEASINNKGLRDILFVNLLFPGHVVGHIYAAFAGPSRERRLVVHTMREIIVFDGLLGSLELLSRRAPDARVESGTREYDRQFDKARIVEIPPGQQPLMVECQHFLDCIRTGGTPLSGGQNALAVMRTLERIERALKGRPSGDLSK